MKNSIIKIDDYVRLKGLVYSHDTKCFISVKCIVCVVISCKGLIYTAMTTNLKKIDFILLNVEKIIFKDIQQQKIKVVLNDEENIKNIYKKIENDNLSLNKIRSLKKDIKKIRNKTKIIDNFNENSLFNFN
ncbi:hypothetical protein KO488_08285 [Poseidonibacter lekithochrous]|uniref:hypothetical protein n=1 Tax=Poseidonibacter TaxID=2321187 RepID=UPI001C08D44C|nr:MULTISPECIES: hypothetical protein [Poseidonibacter]MBU3014752.1 hypothetical protein [Poseidonibacter lekithochrous]MDO6828050.1 hypothetical protein [Poseidonibacter sp. 1_MG-2023]